MFAPGGANTKQVSRTVEVRLSWSYAPLVTYGRQHAFDDFAIAQVAKILGKTDDVEKVCSSFSSINPQLIYVPVYEASWELLQCLERQRYGARLRGRRRHDAGPLVIISPVLTRR